MSNNSFMKWAMALVLLAVFFASAYPAAAAYTLSGKVVDINGFGIPGAKVTLYQSGLQMGDSVMTVGSGSDTGTYVMVQDTLPWGDYQMFADKDGKQSSTIFKVTGSYKNFSVPQIGIRNYAISGVPPTATPTATPTVTPTATPAASPSVTATPTAEASAAPENVTATPAATVETTVTPVPTPLSKPTPGFEVTLGLAALGFCLIVLRRKN